MSERNPDLSGNTAQFQAFVQRSEPEPAPGRAAMPWIIGIAVAAIVVVGVVIAFLVAS